jgi:hypothetical protein
VESGLKLRSQMREVFIKTFRMYLTMFYIGKIPKCETGEVIQVKGQLKDCTIIQHQNVRKITIGLYNKQ